MAELSLNIRCASPFSNYTCQHGKYKGSSLSDLTLEEINSYLEWCEKNVGPSAANNLELSNTINTMKSHLRYCLFELSKKDKPDDRG